MADLVWKASASYTDGGQTYPVGYQENGWFALPDEDLAAMQSEAKKYLAFAAAMGNKNGGYSIEFTGSTTEGGTVTPQPVVKVEGMTIDGLNKYMRRALKLSDWLVDWAEDDAQHGQKVGWDHKGGKGKPPKP